MKLLILFLSLLAVGCLGFEDGDEDTVIINGLPEGTEPLTRNKRQFSVVLPADVGIEGSACDSLTKERGNCTTISDCYPLIYSTEGEENRDPGLIDVFKSASGVCEPPSLQYVLLDGTAYRAAPQKELICCTSGQQGMRPLIPPTNPGPASPEKFVVGGTPADQSRFPWIVSMHVRGRHSCGGSLINRNTVLTAAHCVQSLRPQDVSGMKIYFGHHDISQGSALRGLLESRTAAQIKYHRGFSMRTLQDDIALIILNSPAPDNHQKIKPVALSNVESSDKLVTVAGWGQTSWTSPTSSRLLEATMDVWTPVQCQLKYSGFQAPVRISAEKQVCAGSPGRDSCRGDSGGPLHVSRGGTLMQVGIVSFGGKCGEFPGVYTKPTAYSAWIQKNQKN